MTPLRSMVAERRGLRVRGKRRSGSPVRVSHFAPVGHDGEHDRQVGFYCVAGALW